MRPNGGARPGAGRKKKASTILKEQSIRENQGEAEKCLQFLISVRDGIHEPTNIRIAAADMLLDRIWGKPKQAVQHSGEMSCRMVLVHPK